VFSSNGDGFVFHDRTGASNPREANLGLDVFPSPADQWVRCRAWKGLDAEAEQVVLQDYFDDAARRPPLTGTHSKPIEHLLPRRDHEATTTAWPALCSHSPRTRMTASHPPPDLYGGIREVRFGAERGRSPSEQRTSQKGGERAYRGRLGKDRSLGESRHSSASTIRLYRPFATFLSPLCGALDFSARCTGNPD
jgi:hypothetical protein